MNYSLTHSTAQVTLCVSQGGAVAGSVACHASMTLGKVGIILTDKTV